MNVLKAFFSMVKAIISLALFIAVIAITIIAIGFCFKLGWDLVPAFNA